MILLTYSLPRHGLRCVHRTDQGRRTNIRWSSMTLQGNPVRPVHRAARSRVGGGKPRLPRDRRGTRCYYGRALVPLPAADHGQRVATVTWHGFGRSHGGVRTTGPGSADWLLTLWSPGDETLIQNPLRATNRWYQRSRSGRVGACIYNRYMDVLIAYTGRLVVCLGRVGQAVSGRPVQGPATGSGSGRPGGSAHGRWSNCGNRFSVPTLPLGPSRFPSGGGVQRLLVARGSCHNPARQPGSLAAVAT